MAQRQLNFEEYLNSVKYEDPAPEPVKKSRSWFKFGKIFLSLFGIPCFLAAVFFSLEQSGFFNLTKIDFQVENLTKHPQYIDPLVQSLRDDLQVYFGKSLWDLDLMAFSEHSKRYLWLENIHCVRKWPNSVQVKIRLREVKLLMMSGKGDFRPLLEDGSLLDVVNVKNLPDVPILQGAPFEKNLQQRVKALNLIKTIPDEGTFSLKNISEIRFDEKDGFWMTLIQDGIKVKFGHDNFNSRTQRVNQVLSYMEAHQMKARFIDADLSKKVVVRK